MGRKRNNTFSKALGHLKSNQIIEAAPTNSTTGVYSITPGTLTRTLTVPGPTIPDESTIDWDVDGEYGRDTSGLFDGNGDSKFIAPPGDNSYILGPMAAMYYTWAYPWTMVGYIRESDRRMVNLGRIDGKLGDWDGSSGNGSSGSGTFYSYGQLTTEQAQWFRDTNKKDNAGNDPDNANYRAFYPGPPSNTPDAFGRYYCTITGTPIATKDTTVTTTTAPIELQASDILSAILDRQSKGISLSKAEKDYLKNNKKSQGQENKFLDTLNKGLTGLNNVLSAITDNPVAHFLDQILPSKIIADTITDRIMGGDNPNSYNGQLMMQLLGSIVTGNNAQIKLSNQGKQNMFDSIDASKIPDAITFGSKPNPDADNAIQPGKKVENVLTKGWGDQGGSEFNYDPKTGMVTITSNKMLRAMDGDQTNSSGKIVQFEDIPNPTTDQINDMITNQPAVQKYFDLITDVPGVKAGMSKERAIQAMNDYVPEFVKAVYNFTVEGTASNAVWLRQQLTKLGVSPQSESEKQGAGFGGHVYSQESLPLDKLSPEVQKAIRSKMNQQQSYTLSGNILSESRKTNILKNLKNPVVLPETKQKSYKVNPGRRLKTNFQGMDKLVNDITTQEPFKRKADVWSKDWQGYNSRLSQDKKNMVLELIGDGKHYFDYMLSDSKIKNAEEMEKFWGLHPEMHSYFYNGKKYKATRKEEVKGDMIVFMEDENGVKSTILQSELNLILETEHEKEMLSEYNKLNEPIPFFKDPLMKKVAKRLKNEIEYEGKPAVKGYPDEPPAKQVDGWHPEYGKKYKYDKLDPVSAIAMRNAPTGDPEIDANVEKAARKPKVKEEYSDWRQDIN